MTDEEILAEAARRLQAAIPSGSRVLLFGSRARGEQHDGSDFDLLVVEPEVEHKAQESFRLREAIGALGAAFDVVVVGEHQVSREVQVPGSLVERAVSEGRVVARR